MPIIRSFPSNLIIACDEDTSTGPFNRQACSSHNQIRNIGFCIWFSVCQVRWKEQVEIWWHCLAFNAIQFFDDSFNLILPTKQLLALPAILTTSLFQRLSKKTWKNNNNKKQSCNSLLHIPFWLPQALKKIFK